MEKLMEVQSKNLVVKSNRLVEAGYKLTLQEQRVILLCIAKIKPREKLENKTFRITAEEYAERFGVKINNAYKELKQIIDTLYDRSVKLFDREANIEGELRWIQKKFYFNNEGYAQIMLTEGIVPLLSELKSHFTSYNLDHIASMKSVYAIRLYELFKQFGCIGKRQIDLDWLKERLYIDNLYSAFADLKRRVVDPALKEINKHSDLDVTYKLIKKGKKVTSLEFSFHKKDASLDIVKPIEIDQEPLIQELLRLGISKKQAISLLKEFGGQKVQQGIEITKLNIEKKQIKKSVSGFLINAIKNGYTSYEVIERKENILKAEKAKRIEIISKKIEEYNLQYQNFTFEFISEKVDGLSPEEKQKYIDAFIQKADSITLKSYKKAGLNNKLVYSSFINFMKDKYELPTQEQFYFEHGINIAALKAELETAQQ